MFAYEGCRTPARATTNTMPTAAPTHGRSLRAAQCRFHLPELRSAECGGPRRPGCAPTVRGQHHPGYRISPIAKNYLQYYALPTQPGNANGQANFLSTPTASETRSTTRLAGLDVNLSDKHSSFRRPGPTSALAMEETRRPGCQRQSHGDGCTEAAQLGVSR